MKWFKESIDNLNDLRACYKKLIIKYHPDNNSTEDTTSIMQEINAEYDALFKKLKSVFEKSSTYEQQTDRQKQSYDWQKDQQIRDIILALCRFANYGVQIEIIGTWVWVTGNTKQYKEELKKLNLKYAKNKQAWYIHFDDFYKGSRSNVSMSFIRQKYGSVIVNNAEQDEKDRRLQQC